MSKQEKAPRSATAKPLYEQVAGVLEAYILNGRYKKGDLLPSEKELMDSTGVSRITVREAFRRLAEVGVIETKQGKGSIVLLDRDDLLANPATQINYQEYRRLFMQSTATRLILEPEIAASVAQKAETLNLKPLEKALDIEDKFASVEIENSDSDGFHKELVRLMGNEVLSEIFELLDKQESQNWHTMLLPPARQKTLAGSFHDQHQKIFKAIQDGNSEFAYFYMKEHLLCIKEAYEDFFDSFYRLGVE